MSPGLSIHTFHGNFFVRSTDLVSLPNVSPDSGFSMQIDIEDSLTDSNLAVFQSALLYTSTKGSLILKHLFFVFVFKFTCLWQRYQLLTTQAVFLISTLVSAFFTGERRIRVHTLALPITNKLADLYATADVQAIATLLAKMGESALLFIPSCLLFDLLNRSKRAF